MMVIRKLLIVCFCGALAACSTPDRKLETATPNPTHKIGKPYKVAGKTYYPEVNLHYDRTGLASWYGSQFHGRKTANGDVFNMNDLTAAHTTLPMPSYVRVTNVENGRWLILKINDRGPFVGNRLIDVSRRAAQLLGFEKRGVTRVRVQAVNGPRGELPQKILDQTLAQILPQEKIIPLPPEIVTTEKLEASGKIYVQIGAFANKKNAEKVYDSILHFSNTEIDKVDINGQNLYRVRIGPHSTVALADIILGRILSLGHNTARIIMEE